MLTSLRNLQEKVGPFEGIPPRQLENVRMEENLTAQAGRAEPPDARNSSIDFAKEPDQGRLYRAYKMLEKDPQKAILELKALVKVHSIMSMIYLGDAYKFGTGVEANLNEAEEWYRLAANAGSLPAHYLLGRLYLNMERYAEAKMEGIGLQELSKSNIH